MDMDASKSWHWQKKNTEDKR